MLFAVCLVKLQFCLFYQVPWKKLKSSHLFYFYWALEHMICFPAIHTPPSIPWFQLIITTYFILLIITKENKNTHLSSTTPKVQERVQPALFFNHGKMQIKRHQTIYQQNQLGTEMFFGKKSCVQ